MSIRDYFDEYWGRGLYPDGSGPPDEVLELCAVHIGSGTRCLDLGCGNGRALGPWALARGAEYFGVDVSPAAVEEARTMGLEAQVIDDATSLPFDDASFDAVVCIEVLEHLLRPDHALGEIIRVLAAGGVAIATVPNIVYWRRRLDALVGRWHPLGDDRSVSQPWRDPHLRFFTPRTLGAMFVGSGFEDVHVAGHSGAVLRDLPMLRRFSRGEGSAFYRRWEQRLPSLLGARVNCVARKPAVPMPGR